MDVSTAAAVCLDPRYQKEGDHKVDPGSGDGNQIESATARRGDRRIEGGGDASFAINKLAGVHTVPRRMGRCT